MKFVIGFFSAVCLWGTATAQFAPQAGVTGCTAISATSGQFVAWATHCSVQRGYQDIANPSLGYVSAGDSSLTLGPADHNIVSLGDSGVATLTFDHPIIDSPGADFAVFENGFLSPSDATMAFLELAFVEVSSDGINYYRFPATSNTQINTQIPGAGVYMDASLVNNLAGKYVSMYGTPFDLQELAGTPGLDINNVTHVRIVDVVGATSGHSSTDHLGHIINDPYPTNFFTGGFDLDAVGVIHQANYNAVTSVTNSITVNIYPNPTSNNITIALNGGTPEGLHATITGIAGNILQQFLLSAPVTNAVIEQYPAGMYYIVLQDANGNKWVQKVFRR